MVWEPMTCRLPRRWLPTNEKVKYNLSYWQSLLINRVLSKPWRSVTTCAVEHVHLQQMESWMLSPLLLDHFCMWNWAHLARRTDRPTSTICPNAMRGNQCSPESTPPLSPLSFLSSFWYSASSNWMESPPPSLVVRWHSQISDLINPSDLVETTGGYKSKILELFFC